MNMVVKKEMQSTGEICCSLPLREPHFYYYYTLLKQVGYLQRRDQVLVCIHWPPHHQTLLLFLFLSLFFFLSWVDSPNPDGGVDLLPVPPAAVYGNGDGKLLPNREKNRGGLTLNWVGSTISISTRGAEKPALICGGNVNHFTIRACCSFAFGFSFFPPHKLLLLNI